MKKTLKDILDPKNKKLFTLIAYANGCEFKVEDEVYQDDLLFAAIAGALELVKNIKENHERNSDEKDCYVSKLSDDFIELVERLSAKYNWTKK